MARLKDVPGVIRTVGFVGFAKRVWQQVGEDAVFTWGAALAYSWMFAVFPFLIFLLSLVPLLPDKLKDGFQQNAGEMVDQVVVGDTANAFKKTISDVLTPTSGKSGFFSIGLLLTIWAASGGMAMTMSALDKAYDIDKSRPYIKGRLVAIALTIASASLIILVMVLLPVGTAVLKWLSHQGTYLGWTGILINLIRYPLAIAMLFAILALIYHYGPSFKQKFQAVTPGAFFCVVVWLILGASFRLYLTKFGGAASYNKTYGAVAGAAILLLFFYIDALVLLIGAEINSEIDFAILGMSGGKPGDPGNAPLPAANEPEHKALAEELVSRGAAHHPNRQGPGTQVEKRIPPPPVQQERPMINKALLAFTGISFLVLMFQRRKLKRMTIPPSREASAHRFREMYPLTYTAMSHRDGKGSGRD